MWLAGYGAWKYFLYESGLREAKEAYVIPKSEMETAACEIPAATTACEPSTPTPSAPVCMIEPTNILVLGIDTGKPYNRRPRSDNMMIYSLQPCKNRILEVSIPRDSRVKIPAYQTTNINRAFEAGRPLFRK